jgi:hypothetical protein
MWRKETLAHFWWECKLVPLLWKTGWRFLEKLKNTTTIWPSNAVIQEASKGNEISMLNRNLLFFLYYSTIQNSQEAETT